MKWIIEPHGNGYILYSGREPMKHGMNLVYMSEPDTNWESTKRLIEAAPYLLGVCELVSRWITEEHPKQYSESMLLELVNSAINKAKI